MAVYAQFETTEGNFTIRLFDQEAPNTVANFLGLAEGTKEWTDPRTNQKVTPAPQQAWHPVDGERGAEHQRRSVLHHARADTASR